MDDNEFEPQVRKPQEVKIIDDQQLKVLPTNEEEEKEEILLTNTAVETTKTKMSSKIKSSERRRRNKISSLETRKLLERHTAQLDNIIIALRSIQKDVKSQVKQLHGQLSQIQKNIAKKNLDTAIISPRRKMPNRKNIKRKR
jgi:hypothetical protein